MDTICEANIAREKSLLKMYGAWWWSPRAPYKTKFVDFLTIFGHSDIAVVCC